MAILKVWWLAGLALLSLAGAPRGSLQTPSVSATTRTPNNLFHLATSSEVAIVGTMVSTTGIGKRLSQKELAKLDDLSKTLGGTVFAIQVEEVVIRGADFGGFPKPARPFPSKILIFRKRDAPYFPNEVYVAGQRYLIFLTSIPDQTELQKAYNLDGKQTYYQPFDPENGIIKNTNLGDPFVTNVRQLGQAVRPSDPRQKLQRLTVLSQSRDPEVKKMAEEAIKLIHRNRRR